MATHAEAKALTRAAPAPTLAKQPERLAQPGGPAPAARATISAPPPNSRPADLLPARGPGAAGSARAAQAIQRTAGNARLSRMPGATLQPKLTVGAPNDASEQEADRVADTVLRMPAADDGPPALAQRHAAKAPMIRRDPQDAGTGAGADASVYAPDMPASTPNDPEVMADQRRATQLQDLKTQIDTQTNRLSTTRARLRALPPASSAERTALETTLDQARLELLALLETRSSLLTTEIQRLRVRIGPNPQSSPDRPGLDRLGYELNQREQELQNHRRQMAPLRVWQTQRQVEATQQQIEGVNQEIMNLPPLDPEHPVSDMNDPRVQELMRRRAALEQQKQSLAASAGEQWTQIDLNTRMAYVMDLLVTRYGYPANGAAGLVGNLNAESGVLPQRLEGSGAATPMRTRSFRGPSREFTPQEVRDRSQQQRRGPRLPGVGLAQWTTDSRRRGLFQHQFGGRRMGTDILFNMDAQVDYLVHELQSKYPGVNRVLTNSATSVNDACDEVLYNFEVPGALLDANRRKRPRTDPHVVQVFNQRRPLAQRALTSFNTMR